MKSNIYLTHAVVQHRFFRRLERRTQFLDSAVGLVSNPATHALETETLAAYVASGLGLDSSEAALLGLVHDLGRPPLGHDGEVVLSTLTNGRFNHAQNSVRLLEKMEVDLRIDFGDAIKRAVAVHSCRIDSPVLASFPMSVQIMICSDKFSHVSADTIDALAVGLIGDDEFLPMAEVMGSSPAKWAVALADDVIKHSDANCLRLSEPVLRAFVAHRLWLYGHVDQGTAAGNRSAYVRTAVQHLARADGRCGTGADLWDAALEVSDLTDEEVLGIVQMIVPDDVIVATGTLPTWQRADRG